jgi:hypothetical protein
MDKFSLALAATVVFVSAALAPADATTTFVRSTVERIDHSQHTITFQDLEGQQWTLRVANPELLKKDSLAKGDQVTIEVNPNDEVTIILKLAQPHAPDRAESK